MKTVAIVQARMGSSRFPGKSLAPLAGMPMVGHVLRRAQAIEGVDEVVLATSLNERDEPLVALAGNLRVRVWRGSEQDVLGRFAAVEEALSPDLVMRITGDCPFTAPDVCATVLQTLQREPWWDYVSNDTTCSGYPDGTDCEVFTALALRRANRHATTHSDREHVTRWMRRNLPRRMVSAPSDYRHVKISVDTAEDMELARRIFAHLPPGRYAFEDTLRAYHAAVGPQQAPEVA